MSESDASLFWEAKYSASDSIWSGEPNASFVAIASDLTPGTALELGCGEGADSVWLAQRGWRVTGIDLSAVAIERARAAASASSILDGSATFETRDLAEWATTTNSPDESFDLVAASFLHSPVKFPRAAVLRRAARAVAPGGHLLLVSHAAFPGGARHAQSTHSGADHGAPAEPLLTAQEEIDQLNLATGEWTTVIAESRSRTATAPGGSSLHLDDVVVLLRRAQARADAIPARR